MRGIQFQVPETSCLYVRKQVVKKVAPDILDTALQMGQDIMKGIRSKAWPKKQ